VCFYMVAIPEAAIPTDRDRIGTPPPQRVEPYKNTLEKKLHNTREGYGLTAQTRRYSDVSAMLASVFLYGKFWSN
jgi:hypothetical protein